MTDRKKIMSKFNIHPIVMAIEKNYRRKHEK
jgi:hypothetical protein